MTAEEHADIQDMQSAIAMKNARKKARREAQQQQQQHQLGGGGRHWAVEAGAAAAAAAAASLAAETHARIHARAHTHTHTHTHTARARQPVYGTATSPILKKGAKKGSYAARFLQPRFLQQARESLDLDGFLAHSTEAQPDLAVRSAMLEGEDDGYEGRAGGGGHALGGGGASVPTGGKFSRRHPPADDLHPHQGALSPVNRGAADRWGGGGSGMAVVDRSQYVRGSGQIAPKYMLRSNPKLGEEVLSSLTLLVQRW